MGKASLVGPKRAFKAVDLGDHPRIGHAVVSDDVARVLEMLFRLAQTAAGPRSIRHGGGCERDEVEGLRSPRRAVDDEAGQLGQVIRLSGIFGDPPPTLLNEQLRDLGTPEAAPGSLDPGTALLPGECEESREISLGPPPPRLQLRRMPCEHGRQRLEDVVVLGPGRPLRLPRLDLLPAEGTKAGEVLYPGLGQEPLGHLAARDSLQKLPGDMDVGHGFSPLRVTGV